ncbi:MAG: sigma-54-dependent Fis family transcriptional regulator [Nitrospirae bacterium]|nr:sigma-54-dependent Fis family transcriptional regulator [Nitrospirota bacterium]
MYKVVLAVSEYATRQALKYFLESNSYSVLEASNGAIAIEFFKEAQPDAVILDLKLSDAGGLDVLREMRELRADTPVILLASHDERDIAIGALGNGAYDYFPKPPEIERLIFALTRSIEDNMSLNKAKHTADFMLKWHLGSGKGMENTIRDIETAADCNVPVEIQGENGTGKSLIARLIHYCSKRARSPFIHIDTDAAFKGNKDIPAKVGKLFKQAAGGTIYFRGLQAMSAAAMTNLISAITKTDDNDQSQSVRIITSFPTNIMKRENEREQPADFLYIEWFVIKVPPLYERIEDIPFLASKFIAETADELNVPVRDIKKDAITLLLQHSWPGNVRELKKAVRRAMVISEGSLLRPEHFYFLKPGKTPPPTMSLKTAVAKAVRDTERKAILKALDLTSGHKTMAASMLGISRKTLWEKLKEHNIAE